MVSRLSAFVIWALVGATAVFWALRLVVRAPAAPIYAVAVGDPATVRADLSKVLGSTPVASAQPMAAPEVSSRFKLIGIMAPKGQTAPDPNPGVALIAVDGKPPRAFGVGARLDGDLVLQAVSLRTASIGPAQGTASVKLELPPLAPPATGTLPGTNGSGGSTAVAPPPSIPPRPAYTPMVSAPPQVMPSPPPMVGQPVPPLARPEGSLPTK